MTELPPSSNAANLIAPLKTFGSWFMVTLHIVCPLSIVWNASLVHFRFHGVRIVPVVLRRSPILAILAGCKFFNRDIIIFRDFDIYAVTRLKCPVTGCQHMRGCQHVRVSVIVGTYDPLCQ